MLKLIREKVKKLPSLGFVKCLRDGCSAAAATTVPPRGAVPGLGPAGSAAQRWGSGKGAEGPSLQRQALLVLRLPRPALKLRSPAAASRCLSEGSRPQAPTGAVTHRPGGGRRRTRRCSVSRNAAPLIPNRWRRWQNYSRKRPQSTSR